MANKTDTLKKLNKAVNRRAILVHRVSMATTVIAHLAFTWSTVVLLGGYVTSLEKKDFWCLTVLSLAEATRIFDDTVLNERLGQSVYSFMSTSKKTAVDIANDRLYRIKKRGPSPCSTITDYLFHSKLAAVLFTGILMTPVVAAIFSILLLMDISSFLFVALPAWRIVQRDYGFFVEDSDKATLAPALDIFYSLVLLQGGLSFFLFIIRLTQKKLMDRFYDLCKFPEGWGRYAFAQYFQYTMAKSKQDPASGEAASLFSHACELLGSESSDEVGAGIFMLGTLAKQGTVAQLFPILLSREKVHKLFLALGLRKAPLDPVPEMREHAARVVAGFADSIRLVQFPGAARCISTLLEPTEDGGSNELIVQGLYILEKVALEPGA